MNETLEHPNTPASAWYGCHCGPCEVARAADPTGRAVEMPPGVADVAALYGQPVYTKAQYDALAARLREAEGALERMRQLDEPTAYEEGHRLGVEDGTALQRERDAVIAEEMSLLGKPMNGAAEWTQQEIARRIRGTV